MRRTIRPHLAPCTLVVLLVVSLLDRAVASYGALALGNENLEDATIGLELFPFGWGLQVDGEHVRWNGFTFGVEARDAGGHLNELSLTSSFIRAGHVMSMQSMASIGPEWSLLDNNIGLILKAGAGLFFPVVLSLTPRYAYLEDRISLAFRIQLYLSFFHPRPLFHPILTHPQNRLYP